MFGRSRSSANRRPVVSNPRSSSATSRVARVRSAGLVAAIVVGAMGTPRLRGLNDADRFFGTVVHRQLRVIREPGRDRPVTEDHRAPARVEVEQFARVGQAAVVALAQLRIDDYLHRRSPSAPAPAPARTRNGTCSGPRTL